MARAINATGHRFGRLTVIGPAPSRNGRRYWNCECDCGGESIVSTFRLKHTKSCGCLQRESVIRKNYSHGMCETKLYSVWQEMKKRCRNKKHRYFYRYGGRGIAICARWEEFTAFVADMGEPPSPKHTIERVNNDGNYCPENCVWATRKEQGRNKSNNRLLTVNAVTQSLAAWAEQTGQSYSTLLGRQLRGWTDADTILIPISRSNRHVARNRN